MFLLNNEITIKINHIPIQWIPKIELFYPDLPQFPIIYINSFNNNERILAFPVSVSYNIFDDYCDATFLLLSNQTQESKNINFIKSELENRIGFSNKISEQDIIDCCNGNTDYESFMMDLWNYIKISYGDYIPYGKYYEEIFSIVRFISAWQPKTGRQSEMRMLFNFLSIFGESAMLPNKWNHLEIYILPNLKDIESGNLTEFSIFSVLDDTIEKLFKRYFTKKVTINSVDFYSMEKAWPRNKNEFIEKVSAPLYLEGYLTEEEKYIAERLVDAFNRHAWRASYFISSYMNLDKDYSSWSKEFFTNFYENGSKLKGYSEKAMACFLQQGFLNNEAIPIDTWIETFYKYPLGINKKIDFFDQFSNLGKLERLIWLSSQSNKTNMKTFFDVLWCQRYGTTGNRQLRGINPIACYSCSLKNSCVGLKNHLDDSIYLSNINSGMTPFFPFQYECELEGNVPKRCKKDNILIDEFSGYNLTSKDGLPDQLIKQEIISMKDFVYHNE